VQFLPSILVSRILRFVDKAAVSKAAGAALKGASTSAGAVNNIEGAVLALALFGALNLKTVFENQYFDAIITLGASIRGALSAAIYRKALRLSPGGRQENSVSNRMGLSHLNSDAVSQLASLLVFSIHSVVPLFIHFIYNLRVN
jgi:hypothetical protein